MTKNRNIDRNIWRDCSNSNLWLVVILDQTLWIYLRHCPSTPFVKQTNLNWDHLSKKTSSPNSRVRHCNVSSCETTRRIVKKKAQAKRHLTQFILQLMQFLSDIWKHLLLPIAVCFQQMSFHSYNVPFCPIFGRIKFNIWDIKGRTYCIQWTPVDPTVLPLVCFDWRLDTISHVMFPPRTWYW